MGFCLSCCRRRKPAADSERQPLLRSASSDIRQARTPLEHAADVIAAIHAGKLASQDQLNSTLRKLLSSAILRSDKSLGDPALNADGNKVIEDVRELLTTVLQLGMEKNDDNLLQDMIYTSRQLSSVPVQVQYPLKVGVNQETTNGLAVAALAIPTEAEVANDTAALIKSIQTLASLLLTSSAFRLILSDVLSTAREIAADSVEKIREAAEIVESVATKVEDTVRPGGLSTKQSIDAISVKEIQAEAKPEEPSHEVRDIKEVIMDRVEDIIRQAQASPSYNSALRTILFLLRKYATRIRIASAALSSATDNPIEVSAPVIAPDPQFSRVLEDVKVLLERFASGKSLDSLLTLLSKTVTDVASATATTSEGGESPAAVNYFDRIGIWLDTALTDPQFARSRAGRLSSSKLYDEGRALFTQNGEVRSDFQRVVQEIEGFTDALKKDRTTSRFLSALSTLQTSFKSFLYTSARQSMQAAQNWHLTVLKILIGWLLPRILSAMQTIPMPRVEYLQKDGKGSQLAIALDTLLLGAAEALVPDVLTVQQWGEVRLEMDEELGAGGFRNVNTQVLVAKQNLAQADSNGHSAESLLPVFRPEADALETGASGSGDEFEQRNGLSRNARLTTSSRVRIHMEGLRLEAKNLGYYARYDLNSWLGYEDEGLMSIDVGKPSKRGEGLGMDIELEVETDSNSAPARTGQEGEENRLFKVLSVDTSLPGLALRIARSNHWLLNSALVAPLAGPIGRAVGTRILSAQIKDALEKFEEVLRAVKQKAEEKAEQRGEKAARDGEEVDKELQGGIWDWWEAVLERFGGENAEEDEGEDDRDVYTESHTNTTLRGIVHETYTQPEPLPVGIGGSAEDESGQPPLQESTIAVGLSAQILPGKAEPLVARSSPAEVVKNVASGVQESVDDARELGEDIGERTREVVGEGIVRAAEVRRELESAEVRMKKREGFENRRRGWRSRAFDL